MRDRNEVETEIETARADLLENIQGLRDELETKLDVKARLSELADDKLSWLRQWTLDQPMLAVSAGFGLGALLAALRGKS